MARPKHSLEAQEQLLDLLHHPGMAPLLVELEAQKALLASSMLDFDLPDGEIIRRKCRYDGAHKLLSDFKVRLETLKALDKKSKA